jgi:hypothetical protein
VFTARYVLSTVYLCVLCGSENKQRLFHCTALTDWFLSPRRSVFTARYVLPTQCIYGFVWIWEQTSIISLYSINWLVFITETECVYCAVRNGYVYTVDLEVSIRMQIFWGDILFPDVSEEGSTFVIRVEVFKKTSLFLNTWTLKERSSGGVSEPWKMEEISAFETSGNWPSDRVSRSWRPVLSPFNRSH